MKKLAELTYPRVEEELAKTNTLVMLPVGSCEEHGPHMPLLVDSVVAEELAREAAGNLERQGYNVLLAPTIPFGVAKGGMAYPGTVTLEPGTLKSLVVDICRSLSHHGFKTVIIVNGHMDPGHVDALGGAVEELLGKVLPRIFLFGFSKDREKVAAVMAKGVPELYRSQEPKKEGHAGEGETSMFLHSRPDLVNRDVLAALPTGLNYDPEEFHSGKKSFKEISEGGRGYFGSPSLATPELGKKVLTIRGKNLADEILKALKA